MLLFQKETKCIVKHIWLKDRSNSEREGLQNGQGDFYWGWGGEINTSEGQPTQVE